MINQVIVGTYARKLGFFGSRRACVVTWPILANIEAVGTGVKRRLMGGKGSGDSQSNSGEDRVEMHLGCSRL